MSLSATMQLASNGGSWISTQFAAAQTSSNVIVSGLAKRCSAKGVAILALLIFAGGCFTKAYQNRRVCKDILSSRSPKIQQTVQQCKNIRNLLPHKSILSQTKEISDLLANLLSAEIESDENAARMRIHLKWAILQAVSGGAALVGAVAIAVFVRA